MIYYICTARHAYTVGVLLSYYGPVLDDTMRVLPYERLEVLTPHSGDVVIWTDFDRLTDAEAERAAELRDRIASTGDGVMQLNHPTRSAGRFKLLRDLHLRGVNAFNVYRFDEATPDMAFPVFIRNERGTSRRAPDLLQDWASLQAAMADQLKRGGDTSDLMIIEFSAKPGADGRYRKYAVFRFGDEIFPQSCEFGDHWFVKFDPRVGDEDTRREDQDFQMTNPHAEVVRPLFEAAEIGFGRMDYGIVDGRIQVFEINTNPTLVSQPRSRFDDFDHMADALRMQDAFVRLQAAAGIQAGARDGARSHPTPEIEQAHANVMAAVRRTADRRHRRRVALGYLKSLIRPVRRILPRQRGSAGH